MKKRKMKITPQADTIYSNIEKICKRKKKIALLVQWVAVRVATCKEKIFQVINFKFGFFFFGERNRDRELLRFFFF